MSTQQQLKQVYANAILSEDANLAPSLQQGQDLYFKQQGVTQVVATASEENNNLNNNIFPASSSSTLLYQHASNLGIPPITGALPTYGNVTLTASGTSPVTFTIPSGTILTNNLTAVQYFVTTEIVINSGVAFSTIIIPIQSSLSGTNTYSPSGTTLVFSAPFVLSPTVTINSAIITPGIISGIDLLTDYDVSNLVYSYMQNPRGGGSSGDYFKWSLESSGQITFAKIIPSGTTPNSANFLLIAIMGGSGDPNFNINLSYPISRSSSLATINTCYNYINGLRPIEANPIVITVSTFGLSATTPNYVTMSGLLNPIVNMTVALTPGLTLDTLVTGTNGVTQTVRQWINYQFRYAVLSVAYGGVTYDGGQYMLGEQMIAIILNGLGSSQAFNGTLCSILVNATFLYSDSNITNSQNIPVPDSGQYYIVGTPTTINIIYDIDISIINLTVV